MICKLTVYILSDIGSDTMMFQGAKWSYGQIGYDLGLGGHQGLKGGWGAGKGTPNLTFSDSSRTTRGGLNRRGVVIMAICIKCQWFRKEPLYMIGMGFSCACDSQSYTDHVLGTKDPFILNKDGSCIFWEEKKKTED